MSTKPDGGPAFPTSPNGDDSEWAAARTGGMMLRDWFAGQALVGLLAFDTDDAQTSAREAYEHADAMLAERVKP